jgi:hypothetical protein
LQKAIGQQSRQGQLKSVWAEKFIGQFIPVLLANTRSSSLVQDLPIPVCESWILRSLFVITVSSTTLGCGIRI